MSIYSSRLKGGTIYLRTPTPSGFPFAIAGAPGYNMGGRGCRLRGEEERINGDRSWLSKPTRPENEDGRRN
jgi:hypothetical protein